MQAHVQMQTQAHVQTQTHVQRKSASLTPRFYVILLPRRCGKITRNIYRREVYNELVSALYAQYSYEIISMQRLTLEKTWIHFSN